MDIEGIVRSEMKKLLQVSMNIYTMSIHVHGHVHTYTIYVCVHVHVYVHTYVTFVEIHFTRSFCAYAYMYLLSMIFKGTTSTADADVEH